ncbi:hypothetical protein GCM10007966_02440 [Legionella impletisoli]|uniref:Capsule polysaccharide export inner-membrane protein ctrB n=1 Tax=Legionella impletisoli TaxID=343510 RepID=A0A917JNM4_9GAMM|nr:hypothetical protein GCM10007966_02440 [Legionella impletisoli]
MLQGVKNNTLIERLSAFIKSNLLFSLLVLIPWLFAAVYILLIKAPLYESNAKILIGKSESKISNSPLLGGYEPASENYLTRDYILSREILTKVEQHFPIKEHFQSKYGDLFSRLSSNSSQNAFLDYYRSKVSAVVDTETNEIVIKAKAFTPEASKKILDAIILQTREFVNQVSNTLFQKQYDFANLKLQHAKEKLFKSSKELIEWQNQNGVFDPKETAHVVSSAMAKLKSTLVEKQTELITYSSFMQPNSNKIVTLQSEIDALKTQIKHQSNILLGKAKEQSKLNKMMSDFEWIQLQSKFAQVEYQAAQEAFDAAESNLLKNQNIVIEIEPPNLPDEASSPQPFYDLMNILFILLILYVLAKMTILIVKEHID